MYCTAKDAIIFTDTDKELDKGFLVTVGLSEEILE